MCAAEKVFAILTILLFVGWLFCFWLDEELALRKEHHLWPYD